MIEISKIENDTPDKRGNSLMEINLQIKDMPKRHTISNQSIRIVDSDRKSKTLVKSRH